MRIQKLDGLTPTASDKVRYLSTDQWAYASEIADIIRKEDAVQANLMIGYFAAEAFVIAESAYQSGAIQVEVGTTTRTRCLSL